MREALAGLVTDGSITQAQADEVATTTDRARPQRFGGGHGGGGRGDMAAAAEALGITQEELRTRTQAGQTLADIAEPRAWRRRTSSTPSSRRRRQASPRRSLTAG